MHPVETLLVPLGKAFRNRRADEKASLSNAPEFATSAHFPLTSPNFEEGQEIPAKHCGWLIGDNISPPLAWSGLPEGTTDLLLVMEDLDSPGVIPRIHTIAEFAPIEGGLPEGALVADAPGVSFLPRRRGPGTYAGPRPLPGHGPHHYRFHLYALDTHIDVATVADAERLPAALKGHVMASGTLTGTRTS